jgi:hypothetical protein
MNATSVPHRFLAASAGTIVQPRSAPAVALPVSVAQVGHFGSLPAEIEGAALPPHFRPSDLSELPVAPAGMGQARWPAAVPVADPRLVTARRS